MMFAACAAWPNCMGLAAWVLCLRVGFNYPLKSYHIYIYIHLLVGKCVPLGFIDKRK